MTARAILSGILLSLLFGCGSGGGSNNSVNGTRLGNSMQAADATSANGTIAQSTTPPSNLNAGIIGISSVGAICSKVTAGQAPKSSQFLLLVVVDFNGAQSSAPTAPGTYTVSPTATKRAGAQYIQLDANCQNTVGNVFATSGTVTLTSVNNGSYAGTFDLTLNSGDHITGSFSASNCIGLVPFLALPQPACV